MVTELLAGEDLSGSEACFSKRSRLNAVNTEKLILPISFNVK